MFRGKKDQPKHFWAVGLGAGLAGAALLALRYAIRPATKNPVPDVISPAQFKTRVFQTSRGELVYHEAGQGQPILFIHSVGVGASSYEWSSVYQGLTDQYRVIAIDLLGFGESQRPSRLTTAEDHAVALADFVRALCWGERPILIGSGLGAGFCVLAASQHPDLIHRVVLMLPLGLNDSPLHGSLPFGLRLASRFPILNRFIYRNYLSRRPTIREWLERSGFHDPAFVSEELVNVYTTCAQQLGAEHAIFSLIRGRYRFDFEQRLIGLSQPVTLIWGDSSPHSVERAKQLQERIQLCRLEILKNVRLLAAREASETLIAILREDLQHEIRILKAG